MKGFEVKLCNKNDCSTPAYEPTYWNYTYYIRISNNCYNYANNRRTDTIAQPGVASGQKYTATTCDAIKIAALNDGLEWVGENNPNPPTDGKALLSLVIKTNYPKDYHWFRQDTVTDIDGQRFWSSKNGGDYVIQLIRNGKSIYPKDATVTERGGYDIFCGYYKTCSNQNQGEGQANIR
jgi:hypothetical protein